MEVTGTDNTQGPNPPPPTGQSGIDLLINHAATQYNLDPALFRRQLMAESSLNPSAAGPGGEIGVAQFTPATARAMGIDPSDPAQAIPAAALMMRHSLNAYGGDYNKALAAYNWGSGNIAKFGMERMPASTAAYIQKITGKAPMGQPFTGAPAAPPPAAAPMQDAPAPTGTPTAAAPAVNPLAFMPPDQQGTGPPGVPTSLADAFVQAARRTQQVT